MTIFATTCFAVAAIRCIEEFIRFCIRFISSWNSKNKDIRTVACEYKKLVATVPPELYEIIKLHCTILGVTITNYTLIAVTERLKRDKVIDA